MKSLALKIEQLEGLLGTKDITPWETGFLQSILKSYRERSGTTHFSAKQVETIDKLWEKYYA